jgi:hypothetical protein
MTYSKYLSQRKGDKWAIEEATFSLSEKGCEKVKALEDVEEDEGCDCKIEVKNLTKEEWQSTEIQPYFLIKTSTTLNLASILSDFQLLRIAVVEDEEGGVIRGRTMTCAKTRKEAEGTE